MVFHSRSAWGQADGLSLGGDRQRILWMEPSSLVHELEKCSRASWVILCIATYRFVSTWPRCTQVRPGAPLDRCLEINRWYVCSLDIYLSRSLHNSAAGGYSVNMVDWKYSSSFSLIWITEKSGQRTPWKSSRWNRVQRFGRTERFDGCSGLYMHYTKPGAVSLRSPRCSEGRQRCSKVRPAIPDSISAAWFPWSALFHLSQDAKIWSGLTLFPQKVNGKPLETVLTTMCGSRAFSTFYGRA